MFLQAWPVSYVLRSRHFINRLEFLIKIDFESSNDSIRLSDKFLSFYKEIIDAQCFILVYRIIHERNDRNRTKWITPNLIR